MSRWGHLKAALFGETSSVGDPNGWLIRAVNGGKTHAGTSVSEFNAMQLPVVYACINRIANPIARFPIRIMRPKVSGGAEEVLDHPLSRRLGTRPNDLMSSRTLRKTVQAHALTWGNGYVEIERNGRGQAVNLWPLLPWNTQPKREDDRFFYRTRIDGTQFDIPHDDVLHIMDVSQDGYVGRSPIFLAREALGMALALEQFGGKFFANDMKSGGFLMHPGKLSSTAQGNLGKPKDQRTDPGANLERMGGLDNAHRVKVLEEGMKFIQTTIPPEDAQFLSTREFQTSEIARMYDVPLIMLQSHEKSTSWGSGIEQLRIGFIGQTIDPWVGAWEQELNWKLFTEEERARGYYCKFNMNAMLRGDMAARSKFYKELFSVGAFSPNRILNLEDEDPIGPDGDHHFVPTNFSTIANAVAGIGRTVSAPPPDRPADEEREPV